MLVTVNRATDYQARPVRAPLAPSTVTVINNHIVLQEQFAALVAAAMYPWTEASYPRLIKFRSPRRVCRERGCRGCADDELEP